MADPDLSELLYDRCNQLANNSEDGFRKQFGQNDMLALCDTEPLNQITSVTALLPIINRLSTEALIVTLKASSGNCWLLRPRAAAKQVRTLNADQRMVYEVIESTYEHGIWVKFIKNKTGIKDATGMDKILKKLQGLNLIKNVKNVQAQQQKTYMLAYLAPSDEITGGSFYDAGDLDESLVDELSNLIIFHVRQMSWVDERKRRIKKEHSPVVVRDDEEQATSGAAAHRKKRKREDNTNDIEDLAPARKQRSQKHTHAHDPAETDSRPNQLAFQPGHAYPTATSIHHYITSNNIIRDVKASKLSVEEVQNVLNVLVWDEKLEQVNGGYRTVRGITFKPPGGGEEEEDEGEVLGWKRGNGFTEAPCGRCPVIELCGPKGLVSAETCVYFERWLGRDVGAAGG